MHLSIAGKLPKELGKLVNLEVFDLRDNEFEGELYVPADMYCVFADIHLCVAGELPKELGNLVNLKELMLQFTGFTGTIVCPIIHKRMHLYLTYTFRKSQELFPSNLGSWSICKCLSSWTTS